MGYWKAVYKDENGRETYYVPDDLNKAKNLSFEALVNMPKMIDVMNEAVLLEKSKQNEPKN